MAVKGLNVYARMTAFGASSRIHLISSFYLSKRSFLGQKWNLVLISPMSRPENCKNPVTVLN